MTRRRFNPTPMVGMVGRSTRAQSVARSTFAPSFVPPPLPRRRAFDDDVILHGHVPFRPYIHSYDTTGSENFTRSEINRELLLTSAAMEDNYDIVNMSRSKDKDVLSRANRAITQTADQTPTRTTGGARQSRGRSSLRRSQLFASTPSTTTPTPTYRTTTTVVPLDLSSPERSSPYIRQANRLHTNNAIREGSYQPLYSRQLRTSPSPERSSLLYSSLTPDRSSYFRSVSRSISPYRSPSRGSSPLPIEESSLSRRPVRKRPKPRVVASKRKLGNYYNRLLNRRAAQPSGAEGKYWPYIDVEDIQDTYTGDLLSDTESVSGGTTYYIESRGDDDDYQTPYTSDYQPSYSSEYQPSYISRSYADDDDDDDIPTDYVPFRPKLRSFSPERDYSKLSVTPYLPKWDPSKNTAADAIAFNAIVASSAERARKALERVSFDDYDDARLVLSVEGEYKPPSSDIPLGFRYISRPIMLKEPASRIVSAYDSDNCFTKYMKDSQSFREGIRARLEEGYRALDTSVKSYIPSLTASHTHALPAPHTPVITPSHGYATTSTYVPSSTTSRLLALSGAEAAPLSTYKPYHTRLRDSEGYKYSHSLELYPVTSRDTTLALPSSREAIPDSHAIRLYDSSLAADSKMSTVDKIQIKANTEVHSTPRSAVAARRVMQRGVSTPPDYISKSVAQRTEVALALARAKTIVKRKPLPPASVRHHHPRVIVKPRYKAHRYAPTRVYVASEPSALKYGSDNTVEQIRRAPLSVLAYLRYLIRKQSKPYVAKAAYTKAALLGRKVDVVTPAGRRRPKSKYAQNKMREMWKEQRESHSYSPEDTSSLRASRPVHQISTHPKPYVPVVPEKKKNLLSWENKASVATEITERPSRSPMLTATLDTYKAPMSAVRRRSRRVLATTKKNKY